MADILSRDFALSDEEVTSYSTPLLTFGSPVLQDHPFAGNDHFLHWIAAAAIAQHKALADSTHAKRNSSWRRYECFLEFIGGRLDPFLRQLGRQEQLETFACFAAALREGQLDARRASTDHTRASTGTVCATLDGVAQAYWLNQFESPIHDRHGRLKPILALQLRGYADADPGVRQQQALPLEVLQRARRRNGNVRELAIGQLIVVAFFFAMRSCEYSCVQGKRMTTIACVDDIRFWADDEIVDAVDSERMRQEDAVSVTFRRQKNRDNGVTSRDPTPNG